MQSYYGAGFAHAAQITSNLWLRPQRGCAVTVRIGKIRFDDWVSLELPGGWSDTFVFQTSPTDGLPPADYARVIRSLIPPVLKLRKSASLWVQCGKPRAEHSRNASESVGEGRWFIQEIRQALWGLPAPVAVTSDSVRPQIWDFSFFPWVDSEILSRPPTAEPYLKGKNLSSSALGCLQVLARANCAYTAEVASLVGFSLTTTRKALHALDENGYIQLIEKGKYPFWKIRRPGLSIALRSWRLPPGRAFSGRKERGRSACKERENNQPKKLRSSSGRHRRTARLWPAWLRRGWPQAQIWAGWSEVSCGRSRPDALCWGRLDGHETLFWLEVESGNTSSEILRKKMIWRINQALIYARRFSARLVFAFLGPPWVRAEGVKVFRDLPDDVAVVVEDWKAFGELPAPDWGKVKWV